MHTVRENLGIEPDADQDSANYRKPDFTSTSGIDCLPVSQEQSVSAFRLVSHQKPPQVLVVLKEARRLAEEAFCASDNRSVRLGDSTFLR